METRSLLLEVKVRSADILSLQTVYSTGGMHLNARIVCKNINVCCSITCILL